ncbi:MAG: hypothetical protein DCF28_09965 [Alphaproteobacteria bacterium]|nr:MAG: hypothetical protein DCF28_09965 [Alphaproteobacteria bacterium]
MSQHNIVGSEAFDREPFVLIRSVRNGGMRRRRSRLALAFVAGAAAAVVGGLVAALAVFGPGFGVS